jgi:hypothetical protein
MTTWMSILDDQAGSGTDLAFPSMSSCAAIICVLPGGLVGIHKTQGDQPKHTRLYAHAQGLIAGAAISDLYIIAFLAGHNVTTIKTAFGCAAAWTYDLARKNVSTANGVCTFAGFQAGLDPLISYKRSTKVVLGPRIVPRGTNLLQAVPQDIATQHTHLLKKHFNRA